MIRKAALQVAAPVLLAFMAFNAYLAITHLRQIQNDAALARESSVIQANISSVSMDLTDMETSQHRYLLTEQPEYIQSYTDVKSRISGDFARLRSALANRSQSERSMESQLESLAGSKQAEIERTIRLRQQGYRHRAFLLVGTDEDKNNMNRSRELVSSLSSEENGNFARLENARQSISSRALSETILGNVCLFVLTACLFGLVHYHEQALERDAAGSRQTLGVRDSQLEKLTSGLADQTRSNIVAIEANARLLLENYGGFLPRQGHEHAQRIQEAAAQLEQLRRDLLGEPNPNIEKRAA
jgi:CHASE3 domain sensor protein